MTVTKGRLIVFTGIDGSGKTTIAKGVAQCFVKRGRKAKYVHGRTILLFSKPFATIGRWMFLSSGESRRDYIGETELKKARFENHHVLGALYASIIVVDSIVQLWTKIALPVAAGRDVICDRYFYDTVITDMSVDMNYSVDKSSMIIGLAEALIPHPDVVFLVDVNEETAIHRKTDIRAIEYLKDRRSTYRSIGQRLGFIVVNGEAQKEALLNECLSQIDSRINL